MLNLDNKIILNAIENYDSPFYLYDGNLIKLIIDKLKTNINNSINIFYSLKANPSLGICELINSELTNCEVCSEGELLLAFRAGFKPENIIFVGPGKNLIELELCVKNKLLAIVAESINEILNINEISKKYNLTSSILLRINPNFAIKNAPLKMGGTATQFGIDIALLNENIKQISRLSHIKISGVHIYNGSRILDANEIIINTKNIIKLAHKLSTEWNIKFEYIDIGGGLGIPYYHNETALDINKTISGINSLTKEYLQIYPNTKFILECGRYIVGPAGILVGKVIDIKKSKNELFAITNMGMHCHLAATGIASCLKRNFPVSFIRLNNLQHKNDKLMYSQQSEVSGSRQNITITGPLCTPGDNIVRNIRVPGLNINDIVMLQKTGAYGLSASPGRFLSHGFPGEVLYYDNNFFLLRKKETAEDILKNQLSIR